MLSIFIPVYNEEDIIEATLGTVIAELEDGSHSFEIIVGSNGSTDKTVEILERLSEADSRIHFFHLPDCGPGRAFVKAVRQAQGDFIVTLDADLSSDLIFLEYSVSLLKYADMVIGCKSWGRQRRTVVRVLGSLSYIYTVQAWFDVPALDFSMGCKGYRKEAILGVLEHLDEWTGYTFEIFLYLNLLKKKVTQVGIDCEDTRQSRFNLLHEGIYRFRHLYRVKKKMTHSPFWSALRQ